MWPFTGQRLCFECWRERLGLEAAPLKYRAAIVEAMELIDKGWSMRAAENLLGFRAACISHGIEMAFQPRAVA